MRLPSLPPFRLLEQVLATAIVGSDQTYLEQPCVKPRAIEDDTHDVGIVEFDASEEKRQRVVAKGEEAMSVFLSKWNWEQFKRDCRGTGKE
jgi:NTE family protein